MGDSLTIRIDEALALVSRDDGRTWALSQSAAAEIRQIVSGTEQSDELHLMTAVAAASLAEAHAVRPRPIPTSVPATVMFSGPEVKLGPLARPITRSFGEVIGSRRSERSYRSLGPGDLATLLVTAARVQAWRESEDGYQMTARPVPSAGARHPYELAILIDDVTSLRRGLWHFDPTRCTLIFRHCDQVRLEPAIAAVREAADLRSAPPAIIFPVAHMDRTLARYPGGSTLVWRDAGSLLAVLHLTASACELSSSIIGTSGVLETTAATQDVGALAVGARGRSRTAEKRGA
jgi:SagB-type dehydrogenase family enzyme